MVLTPTLSVSGRIWVTSCRVRKSSLATRQAHCIKVVVHLLLPGAGVHTHFIVNLFLRGLWINAVFMNGLLQASFKSFLKNVFPLSFGFKYFLCKEMFLLQNYLACALLMIQTTSTSWTKPCRSFPAMHDCDADVRTKVTMWTAPIEKYWAGI